MVQTKMKSPHTSTTILFFEVTHHGHHHIHRYNPLGSQEEEIDVVDREDTPTLPEFVEEVIAWYHENEDEIDRVSD